MTTTHPMSPGKSVLIICCNEACLTRTREQVLGWPWPAPVTVFDGHTVRCGGNRIELLPAHQVEHTGRERRYDEIYTCGHVYLPERLMHVLQARLANRAGWPGYFSKFP